MANTEQLDIEQYKKVAGKGCFICNIVRGGDKRAEHVVLYEDEKHISFLNNYPTKAGQALVCPKEHVMHLFRDFDADNYTDLLLVARRVGAAIQDALGAVRMYLASWGSNELNSHVHLHVFPLSPNTPYEEQQLAAMDHEKRGILKLTKGEKEHLAQRIREKI